MFKKLTLAAAAGAGYVLGAKAGKERYQQIEAKFREVAGMPAVQNATAAVKENAAPLLDTAKETVGDKVSAASDKVSGASGASGASGTSGTSGTSSAGGTTPSEPISTAPGTGTSTLPPPAAPGEAPDFTAPEPPIIRP